MERQNKMTETWPMWWLQIKVWEEVEEESE